MVPRQFSEQPEVVPHPEPLLFVPVGGAVAVNGRKKPKQAVYREGIRRGQQVNPRGLIGLDSAMDQVDRTEAITEEAISFGFNI